MANVQMKPFFIDDLTLAWIDRICGDGMSRDAFFRRMIQYGLANTFEELARLSRDYATQDTATKTATFHKGRDLFTVKDPETPDPESKG